jgi:hypothetical protein
VNDQTKPDSKLEPKKPQNLTQKTTSAQKGVSTTARHAKVFENTNTTTTTDENGKLVSETSATSYDVVTSGGRQVPKHITNANEAEAEAMFVDQSLRAPPEEAQANRTSTKSRRRPP